MGQLDRERRTDPGELIEALIADVNDVTTWNLAPLSPITTQYIRNVGDDELAVFAARRQQRVHRIRAAPCRSRGWAQDDWAMTNKLTLNLGLRYDAAIGEFVNWVEFPPFIEADRPHDSNNFAPRLGFNYALNDRTVVRGGYGNVLRRRHRPAGALHAALRAADRDDGRQRRPARLRVEPVQRAGADLRAGEGACSARISANPASPTCNLRHSTQNFAAPDLVDPWSHQASLGVAAAARQHDVGRGGLGVHRRPRQLNTRNINVAYNPATGAPYPFAAHRRRQLHQPSVSGLGHHQLNRSDSQQNYHALQTAFTKRMANSWQASATYTLSRTRQFDQLPLNPGCEYPVTTVAGTGSTGCDVPVTLAPDISENDWYLAGDQRNRVTFNGIWERRTAFQLSGLYIFGDNGWETPQSGVDVRDQGSVGTGVGARDASARTAR